MIILTTLGVFAGTVLTLATTIFLIAQVRQDNSIMDICYGPVFAIATWVTLCATETYTNAAYVVATLVTIWALRLGMRIGIKNWGKPEDARYAAWREKWLLKGTLYFLLRSYVQINLLQGIIIVAVSTPMILVISAGDSYVVSTFMYAGIAIWFLGLLLESVADRQLDQFIARKKASTESATLMTRGLFHYSRRPNYFGESLIWWGLAVIALPALYGYLALISPLLITFILTKVTGPMLEDIFLKKYPEEYRAYMERTSYFVPWWPKEK